MTHDYLCERAAQWLRSTGRCDPVLRGIASCYEIPDAIGWNMGGSMVIECKTSRMDFLRDQKKYKFLCPPDHNTESHWRLRKITKAAAIAEGWIYKSRPNMGDRRYFLCPPEVASLEDVRKFYPDHGLLHVVGRRVHTVWPAPKREHISHKAEIRYLRFALIHVRDNLQKSGFGVDLCKLTQFFGEDGLINPQTQKEAAAPLFANADTR